MKKLSLLILLVMVASLLLGAALPTKLVRLTMINKSDYDVFMKLEGSKVTNAYYYLTVPKGSRDTPVVKVFTVWVDVYARTTWQCDGIKSTGTLVVSQNIRLDFLPCGEFQCKWTMTTLQFFGCEQEPTFVTITHRRSGEPTMEKVSYFKYLTFGTPSWAASSVVLYNGFWNFGCFTEYWRIRTYKIPIACAYRYQY